MRFDCRHKSPSSFLTDCTHKRLWVHHFCIIWCKDLLETEQKSSAPSRHGIISKLWRDGSRAEVLVPRFSSKAWTNQRARSQWSRVVFASRDCHRRSVTDFVLDSWACPSLARPSWPWGAGRQSYCRTHTIIQLNCPYRFKQLSYVQNSALESTLVNMSDKSNSD